MDSKQLFLKELHTVVIKEYPEVGEQLRKPIEQLSWEEATNKNK
ncbi:hypothetical protein V7158_25890 [Priestia megaterium]